MAHARKKSEKHCEVSEYFHSLFSCILCATQRGDIKHVRVASLVRRGAVLHLLHRHTPVAEAGGVAADFGLALVQCRNNCED